MAAVDVNVGNGEGCGGDGDLEGKGAIGCVGGGGCGTGGTGPTAVVFEVGVGWVAGWKRVVGRGLVAAAKNRYCFDVDAIGCPVGFGEIVRRRTLTSQFVAADTILNITSIKIHVVAQKAFII